MADLYGAPPSYDREDFSSFLNQLLHNSSSSSTSSPLCMSLKSKYPNLFHSQLPAQSPSLFSQRRDFTAVFSEEDRVRSAASSSAVTAAASLSGANVLDPGGYIPSDAKECGDNAFSSSGRNTSEKARGVFSENDLTDFSGDSEDAEGSEMPLDPAVPTRSSSKRRRAAEVHNLSEKRRRSRINEKMKALQNLIPNSNKTDKASMLDEAIEYLKQLQLQVQMLSLRNRLSLFPIGLPEGVLQPPMQLPHPGMSFDASNAVPTYNGGGLASFTTAPNQHYLAQSNFNPSETLFRLGPYVDAHYEQFDLTTSSKENCMDGSSPKQESDNAKSPTADVS